MSRNKAILYIASVIIILCTFLFTGVILITFKDVITSSTYLNKVKERKAKLEKLEEEYKRIVSDIHIMNSVSNNMKKDDAVTCSKAINKVASKKDYYYKDEY